MSPKPNSLFSSAASASVPDWTREQIAIGEWNPGKRLLKSIRDYQRHCFAGGILAALRKHLCVFRHRFWSAVSGADIPLNCNIDGGLLIPHPNGVVVHPSSRIGPNCLLFQQTTLAGAVILEGHVDIGAGAKLIGPLTVGVHCRVGANAVVLNDVAAYSTVAGIPAKLLT